MIYIKTIILNETKINFKLLIISITFIFLASAYSLFEYYSLAHGSKFILETINSWPKIIQIIFGVTEISIADFFIYYKSVYFRYCIITFIFACILGSIVLSKESEFKTSEFLFTKAVTREQIVYGKILSSILFFVILDIIILLFLMSFAIFGVLNIDIFISIFMTIIAMFFGQMLFLALSFFISVICNDTSSALNYSLSFLVIAFTLYVFIEYTSGFDYLKYFTPFKFFSFNSIINREFDVFCLLITFIIVFFSYRQTVKSITSRDFE